MEIQQNVDELRNAEGHSSDKLGESSDIQQGNNILCAILSIYPAVIQTY